jgi:hypothetical protein
MAAMTEPVFMYVLLFRIPGKKVWWKFVLTSYELWVSCITEVFSKFVLPLAGGLKGWTTGVHRTVLVLNSYILFQNACLRIIFICVYS